MISLIYDLSYISHHYEPESTPVMSLEFAILGFLAEQPASGYELKNRCFQGPVQSFWKADQAQIYRTLDRLEKQELVQAKVLQQEKRPSKKTFALTQKGDELLHEWLRSHNEPVAIRDPFALRLYFSSTLETNELRTLFSEEIRDQKARLDQVEIELKELDKHTKVQSKFQRKENLVKKSALEVIKIRILAEIEYKNRVLSTLTDL